jgi:hypothetical protein
VACERGGSELLTHAPVDLCLCHGAAGTGDVLLSAAAGPEHRRARLAREIGRYGMDYVGGSWAETPDLFTGLAGVGMFYLRLSDPAVASPLLIALDTGSCASIESGQPARRVS